jgi:hypothetical protein
MRWKDSKEGDNKNRGRKLMGILMQNGANAPNGSTPMPDREGRKPVLLLNSVISVGGFYKLRFG